MIIVFSILVTSTLFYSVRILGTFSTQGLATFVYIEGEKHFGIGIQKLDFHKGAEYFPSTRTPRQGEVASTIGLNEFI